MNTQLQNIEIEIYNKLSLKISEFEIEAESQEYAACKFKLNASKILCRNAKITPTKIGQFVTFWKRVENGPIEPFNENDKIDFYIVNVQNENKLGQFVFPESILIQKGILSTAKKEGKRAFRVYPVWDETKNKQAQKTQQWQLDYFFEINSATDFPKIKELYHSVI